MKAWLRIEPTTEIASEYRSILVKTFKRADGQIFKFDTYDTENLRHAGVVALTSDNKVVVVRQFRPGPERIMDEIPGGTAEPDEEPESAMLRELEEETGFKPGHFEYLGEVRKDAYMNATWHYFLATNCSPSGRGQQLDSREQVEVHLITIDEFINNARTARMTDVEAVFLASDRLLKLKEQK